MLGVAPTLRLRAHPCRSSDLAHGVRRSPHRSRTTARRDSPGCARSPALATPARGIREGRVVFRDAYERGPGSGPVVRSGPRWRGMAEGWRSSPRWTENAYVACLRRGCMRRGVWLFSGAARAGTSPAPTKVGVCRGGARPRPVCAEEEPHPTGNSRRRSRRRGWRPRGRGATSSRLSAVIGAVVSAANVGV